MRDADELGDRQACMSARFESKRHLAGPDFAFEESC